MGLQLPSVDPEGCRVAHCSRARVPNCIVDSLSPGASAGFPKFVSDKLQLNFQSNAEGILECRGHIQGHYPIYLPDDCQFTEKFMERAHFHTL